jgi:FkbM family methyltransferase
MTTENISFLKQVDAKHGAFLVPPKDVYVGRSLEVYGEWCESEVALFAQLVKPGSTVVEAGANIGSHTVPLAQIVGPSGMVFAIEMQPFVAQILSANLLMNGAGQARVVLAGVSDVAGYLDVPMLRYDQNYNYGGISVDFIRGLKRKSESVRVQIQPLDDLIHVTRLDLLKVDVEHLELQVLRGAERLISKHRPVIYLENDDPEATDGLLAFLHGHGYRTFWHRSALFNPKNHRANDENIFGNARCVNLLALPNDTPVRNFEPATDKASHPKLRGK